MRKFVETLHLRRTSLKLGAITVTWNFHTPDPNHNSVFTERSIPRAVLVQPQPGILPFRPLTYLDVRSESDWMETVEAFAKFLKLARPDVSVDPVKIAVIDDGIEASLEEFNGKIHVGESFCRFGELSGRRGAYYVPLGPHYTLMAQLISRVCPAVKLYVAQLEVLPGERAQRSFTTESATEARFKPPSHTTEERDANLHAGSQMGSHAAGRYHFHELVDKRRSQQCHEAGGSHQSSR